MQLSFVGLEVARVDRFQTRLLDRQAQQPPTGRDHRRRRFRPNVVVGEEQKPVRSGRLDPLHPRNSPDPFLEPLPLRFYLNTEAAAQYLASQLGHGADEHDISLTKQSDAIANALHPLKQVRRQQHAHPAVLEVANNVEQLGGCLRVEAAGLPIRNIAQPQQHQNGGGLAGAVRPEQPKNLTARYRERNAVDDGYSVVALGEVLRLDDVHRRPNHTTEPIITSSAPPIRAMPTMPHIVEVVTATRKVCDADSPRAFARTVVT